MPPIGECHLSRAVFVNFELVENAIPSVVEVEDRHVEHQQWIAHSPAALEHFSPFAREACLRSFHSPLLSFRELPPFILILKFIRPVSAHVHIIEFNDHQVPRLLSYVRHFAIAVSWNPRPSRGNGRITVSLQQLICSAQHHDQSIPAIVRRRPFRPSWNRNCRYPQAVCFGSLAFNQSNMALAQRVEILQFALLVQCVPHLRPLDDIDKIAAHCNQR
jgi:hypothetical protein